MHILFLAILAGLLTSVAFVPLHGGAVFSLIVLGGLLHYVDSIAESLRHLRAHFAWQKRIEEFRFRQEYPDAEDVLKSERQLASERQERAAAEAELRAKQEAEAAKELKRKRAEPTYRATEVMPEMPEDFQVPRPKTSTRRNS